MIDAECDKLRSDMATNISTCVPQRCSPSMAVNNEQTALPVAQMSGWWLKDLS